MLIRLIKAALVLTIGLHSLFYALQNLANLEVAHRILVYVMKGADHEAYTSTMFFRTDNPLVAWAALGIVLLGEFAVGFFGIKGGWALFRARSGTPEAFHEAKHDGVIAAGIALLVWFGLFMTLGGAFFQMFQTKAGQGSLESAFMYASIPAITMLYVCLTDDALRPKAR